MQGGQPYQPIEKSSTFSNLLPTVDEIDRDSPSLCETKTIHFSPQKELDLFPHKRNRSINLDCYEDLLNEK